MDINETVQDHEDRIRCMEKNVTILQTNFDNINRNLDKIVKDVGQFKWWVLTSMAGAILLTFLFGYISKYLGI